MTEKNLEIKILKFLNNNDIQIIRTRRTKVQLLNVSVEQIVIYLKSHSFEEKLKIGLMSYQENKKILIVTSTVHYSTKVTPVQESIKSKGNEVYIRIKTNVRKENLILEE